MKYFYVTDTEGNVIRSGNASEATWHLHVNSGETLHEGVANSRTDYVKNGELRKKPERPTPFATWDMQAEVWVDARSLQTIKEAQWLEIKTARELTVNSGFLWDDSKFDSDQVSQARIQGAVSLANMNPAFSITWTLFDNTFRTLSASEMVAVGVALGVHVQTQFDKARALRDQIDAATTREAVFAVVW
jgi:hypothetical protein